MDATIPKTMKALVKRDPVASYELVTVDVPTPLDGETLIRVDMVGICGSDIGLYKWDAIGQSIAKLPFTPGHEATGVIVKHGPGQTRTDLPIGARVAVENHYYCGNCFQCKNDERHICQAMGQFGHGMGKDVRIAAQGGCAEYALVPSRNLYALTTKISTQEACLLEPFGVSHQACEAADVKAGDDMVVLGCGTIGLFAVQVGYAMGASKIIAVDIDPVKLELAKKMGATVGINSKTEDVKARIFEETQGNGTGHLIEATGVSALVNGCPYFVRKGGHICLVGIPKTNVSFDGTGKDFLFRSLTVRTIHGRKLWHTWIESEKLMATKVDSKLVVTHSYPLSQYEEAFDALISGKAVKVLINLNNK